MIRPYLHLFISLVESQDVFILVEHQAARARVRGLRGSWLSGRQRADGLEVTARVAFVVPLLHLRLDFLTS